jgi:AcrR family transcriptional regulator
MDQYPQHMKISELSSYAKIPVTTIRFYIHLGMLPKPIKKAKTMAYYTREHINRLLKIQKLKEQDKLPLASVKEILGKEKKISSHDEEFNGIPLTSTRNQIITTAVELFREKGYGAVTIADIAAKAKISKRTFYQNFSNKAVLFSECLDSIFYDIGIGIPELKTETDGLKRLYLRAVHFGKYMDNMIDMLNLSRYEALTGNDQFREKRDKALANFVEPIRKEMALIINQNKTTLKNDLLLTYLYLGAAEYSYYYILQYDRDYNSGLKEFWDFFFGGKRRKLK